MFIHEFICLANELRCKVVKRVFYIKADFGNLYLCFSSRNETRKKMHFAFSTFFTLKRTSWCEQYLHIQKYIYYRFIYIYIIYITIEKLNYIQGGGDRKYNREVIFCALLEITLTFS